MTDIPAVCDTCLDSDYIEMKRLHNGAECKICTNPFTVFKWKSKNSALHKTVICQTCSRSKNCCQSCLNDLTFGIDIHTRDNLFKLAKIDKNPIARNTATKLYHSNLQKETEPSPLNETSLSLIESKLKPIVKDLQNSVEFTSKLKKLPFNGNLSSNNTYNTFFLFGFKNLDKTSISNYFNIPTDSIHLNNSAQLAFVEFPDHSSANSFASKLGHTDKPALIIINNTPLRICWATTIVEFSSEESTKVANIVSKQFKKLSKTELRAKNSTNAKIHK
ncbi:hypothetical protein CANINC_001838 [Pichia inconspicua]|uniref:Pre-mRNA-splicing factor SLT11 n=1 Tax=Pichia inconspicua TaxID=52247 RepID=A0A4T0X492_9ASCO|nr:hypothetical protein CANINC_001838 [[Candida] inconspicua]